MLLLLLLLSGEGRAAGAFAGGATAQPPAPAFFWHPELAPPGPAVVVVSLDEQRIYVYRNGVAIGASPVSSGRPGYDTPPGVYTILQKAREHRSNLYDSAPMPFMQRLTWDGVALHGGPVPGRPVSHGCIRLPQAFAEALFGVTRRGGVVVVADRRVAPATVTHPAAVAPIDLDGQLIDFHTAAGQPLPPPLAGEALTPLAIIASTRDRRVYVLRGGLLLGTAPLAVSGALATAGTLLYVMQPPPEPGALAEWSAYRILGDGPTPAPADLAGQLRMPASFGTALRALLAPGTTVLVTDLPGIGGDGSLPYAALLQSQPASPPSVR